MPAAKAKPAMGMTALTFVLTPPSITIKSQAHIAAAGTLTKIQAEAELTHFWSLPPHHKLPYEVQEEHVDVVAVLPQELAPLEEQEEP